MSNRSRRRFTAEQKAQIVRRHVAGKKAVSALAISRLGSRATREETKTLTDVCLPAAGSNLLASSAPAGPPSRTRLLRRGQIVEREFTSQSGSADTSGCIQCGRTSAAAHASEVMNRTQSARGRHTYASNQSDLPRPKNGNFGCRHSDTTSFRLPAWGDVTQAGYD